MPGRPFQIQSPAHCPAGAAYRHDAAPAPPRPGDSATLASIREELEALHRSVSFDLHSRHVTAHPRVVVAFNVLLEHAKAVVDPDPPASARWPKAFIVDRSGAVEATWAKRGEVKVAVEALLGLLPAAGPAEAGG